MYYLFCILSTVYAGRGTEPPVGGWIWGGGQEHAGGGITGIGIGGSLTGGGAQPNRGGEGGRIKGGEGGEGGSILHANSTGEGGRRISSGSLKATEHANSN